MKLKKLTAAFSAAAVSLLGLAVIPAFAAELAPGDVDTTKTGSITVHKYANPGIAPDKANPDGTDTAKFANATPIKGVEFTLTKLTMDLTTVQGWKDIPANANAVTDNQKDTTKTINPAKTDADGSVKFANLAVGAYLVEETSVEGATPAVSATGKAASFLVTVPYNNGDAGWLYDVNVYPKNTIESGKASKSIDQTVASNYMKGDNVPWSFTLPVNALEQGKTRTYFGAWDALPTYLKYKNVSNVKFISAAGVETAITMTCEKDTANTWAAATYEHSLYKCLVATNDLSKLLAGGKVTFTLNSTLTGDVPNNKIQQGFALIDLSKGDTDPDVPPTPPVDPPTAPDTVPYYGDLSFKKTDSKTADLVLGGAKFKLTKLGDDGTCATLGADLNGATAVSVKGTGAVDFKDVFVQMAAPGLDDTAVAALKTDYCLVETEAPAGYVKAANTKVTIVAGTTATAGGLENAEFKNEKDISLIPNLPLTGAAGSVILTLAGIALLAVAVGFGIRTARKNS